MSEKTCFRDLNFFCKVSVVGGFFNFVSMTLLILLFFLGGF